MIWLSLFCVIAPTAITCPPQQPNNSSTVSSAAFVFQITVSHQDHPPSCYHNTFKTLAASSHHYSKWCSFYPFITEERVWINYCWPPSCVQSTDGKNKEKMYYCCVSWFLKKQHFKTPERSPHTWWILTPGSPAGSPCEYPRKPWFFQQ